MFETDKKLLNDYQRDFPLVPRPYAEIGKSLGISEGEVLEDFARYIGNKTISRIGAVVKPGTVGSSTLAAMKVPQEKLIEIAKIVSSFDEVNHNYEREHSFNLWFVITAPNQTRLNNVLTEIEHKTGITPMNLPMEHDFHLDLGFKLKW
ncbi:MAG: Lrp/AsnC family transcriptional regulator [Rhodospirillaceae bacterium]|nr:Lrp/AsnC family transcriptional regulator [Rhodospirillaceae bacterium]